MSTRRCGAAGRYSSWPPAENTAVTSTITSTAADEKTHTSPPGATATIVLFGRASAGREVHRRRERRHRATRVHRQEAGLVGADRGHVQRDRRRLRITGRDREHAARRESAGSAETGAGVGDADAARSRTCRPRASVRTRRSCRRSRSCAADEYTHTSPSSASVAIVELAMSRPAAKFTVEVVGGVAEHG